MKHKKRTLKYTALFLLCTLLFTCTQKTLASDSAITFTDSAGRTVTVSNPERTGIASGSLAECWMLAGGTVCAVTQDAFTERSLDIPDGYIDLGSLKNPSLETIFTAELDFLILMSSLSSHMALGETLDKANIPYAYFDVENFSDYLELMKLFTSITGREDLYESNAASLLPCIEETLKNGWREDHPEILLLRTSSSRVKVLNSESMVGSMLQEFGCVNIADGGMHLLSDLSIEAIVEEDPDYIFVTCMGDMEEGKIQLEQTLTGNPIWSTLQAVQNDRVFYLEKELFHYKPNARWSESYEILEKILSEN